MRSKEDFYRNSILTILEKYEEGLPQTKIASLLHAGYYRICDLLMIMEKEKEVKKKKVQKKIMWVIIK